MNTYSQAGQDKFAIDALGLRFRPQAGSFVDIGVNHPIQINNTYALEKDFGFRGLLVDNSGESMEACENLRASHFYLTDAAQPQNWIAAFAQAGLPTDVISYLSVLAGQLD
mgnify:CR=1 FL=1